MLRPSSLLRTSACALVLMLATLVPAAAQGQGGPASSNAAPKQRLHLVVEGGIEFGGEEVVELTFTDGSTQKLTAGQGGTIAIGAEFRPARIPRLGIATTVGYKFVTNASENASIGISRIPVEVVGRWALNDDVWAGAGLAVHSAVRVKGDGFFPDADLEASLAPTLELGWRWVALTYTIMEYTAENDETFAANAIGVSFRWVRRNK